MLGVIWFMYYYGINKNEVIILYLIFGIFFGYV